MGNKLNSRYLALAVMVGIFLTGCSSVFDKHVEWETVAPDSYPVILAIGYAPISAQKGATESSKMLMALKASKLDAYRELTEQVYGQKVDSGQSLASLVIQNTHLDSSVQGVIRGAKVVKSYPVGDDTYATELELDFKLVNDIYLSTARPKRVKKVHYY
ncbi:LPP20 family lipoprotein [uncultured Paraglaciecola sp.]|uniref:LPP20 family lipoprotein n=1 Tax=uncultured Paraglaciecola sp. TaxID=1765024 RepID=UPI0030DDAB43|tara:strand:+ start:56042 stop:56518 length:477 start_codon:yes stop_codon:yes gene_type:complete